MLILVPYVLPEQNLSGKNPRCGINTSKAAEDSAKVSVRVYERIWICILWISIVVYRTQNRTLQITIVGEQGWVRRKLEK
jgi:hypothetical protein